MGDFSWKQWAIKGGKKILLIVTVTGLNEAANYIEVSNLPTEYIAYGAIIAGVLSQIANIIKHKWMIE